MITQKNNLLDQYFADILNEEHEQEANPDLFHASLRLLREEAKHSFLKQGIPNLKMENWKYTPVRPHLEKLLSVKDGYPKYPADHLDSSSLESNCYTLVVIDGKWWPHLSDPTLEDSIEVTEMDKSTHETHHLDKIGGFADLSHPLAALNTALFKDGLIIRIKEGKQLKKPIYLMHVALGADHPMFYPRFLIVAEKNSSATIIEQYLVNDASLCTVNDSVTEIVLEAGATLDHHYIHTENDLAVNMQYTRATLAQQSRYTNYNFSFPGSPFSRHDLHVSLDGAGAETNLYGFVLAGKRQLVDNHTRIDHRVADCISNEHYKCILKDQATVVYNGKVIVYTDAQRTNSFQKNNNLMFSDDAVLYTKPELEIYADDVKCSHGATLGQFDNDALFYLTSRGIRESTARQLMVEAFASEVLDKIADPLIRAYTQNLLAKHLGDRNLNKVQEKDLV